jgi:putative Mg2+ transporter-C (MgtC) family protein
MPQPLFDVGEILVPLAVAVGLALPIAFERKRFGRYNVGLRTIPLVALGACAYVLLVHQGPEASPDASARILQGVITGIGFVAGGAILKGTHDVHGLATAASIWNTGAIGASAAFQRYDVGLVLSAVNVVALHFLPADLGGQKGRSEEPSP